MYKTYIETKLENRDHLGLSKMGLAGYLLTPPRIVNFRYFIAPDKALFFSQKVLGPVVQSIISLTSSLVVKSYSPFFSKNNSYRYMRYLMIKLLTNNIASFEKLGPGILFL